MKERSERLGVKLIPHFKTHQSHAIGSWFKEAGVSSITVSSIKMAEYFAKDGWKDITVAFPINILEIKAINQIISKDVDLKLLIVSADTVLELESSLSGHVKVLIEMDAGYNRTGVSTDDSKTIDEIISAINQSDKCELYGLYCHPGNTYHTKSHDQIKAIWADAISKLKSVKSILASNHPDIKIRMGDTPGCTVVDEMDGIDEIGPGNFVFYDLVMDHIGVCQEEDIAVAVACPVVAKNDKRNQIVIHGGAVHFSKDYLLDSNGNKFFGEVVILQEGGWSPIVKGIKLSSISQEHGILTASEEVMQVVNVGDIIGMLPIHSCLTANLMKSYTTLSGEVLDHMEKIF